MRVSIENVPYEKKNALRQLLELYTYDFTEYIPFHLNEDGTFGYPNLDQYWTRKECHPFFIRAGHHLAGFAMVSDYCPVRGEGYRSIEEFFVMKSYRRQGVGLEAAKAVIAAFPGSKWEIGQHGKNTVSQKFWETVVNEVTGGSFEKKNYVDRGEECIALLFQTERPAPANIELREVTHDTFWEICFLEVEDSQQPFVAPNPISLAQAKYEPDCRPVGIYADGKLVGFGMYGIDQEQNWIHRFMIDKHCQGRGFGKAAFKLVMEKAMADAPKHHALYLSVNKENPVAQRMYEGYGFACNGEWHGSDEKVMVKRY